MLTIMEIVLGIDNLIFISIVAGRLPAEDQKKARSLGLTIALLVRVALLFTISWLIGLTKPLFGFDYDGTHYGLTVKDLILLAGGIFLMWKTVMEIHHKLEGSEEHGSTGKKIKLTASQAIFQIVLLDIVFSFDSILTAVGVSRHLSVMVLAVIISMVIMLIFSRAVSDFVNRHPTIKMLALSFLLLIGFLLVMEGLPDTLHVDVNKNYIYFAMAFAFIVEMLNIRMRKNGEAVKLHEPQLPKPEDESGTAEKQS